LGWIWLRSPSRGELLGVDIPGCRRCRGSRRYLRLHLGGLRHLLIWLHRIHLILLHLRLLLLLLHGLLLHGLLLRCHGRRHHLLIHRLLTIHCHRLRISGHARITIVATVVRNLDRLCKSYRLHLLHIVHRLCLHRLIGLTILSVRHHVRHHLALRNTH